MIKSFKHRGLEQFFCDGSKKGIQPKDAERLADILDLLNAADRIEVMRFPGSGLHLLQPKRQGVWSVKVSANYRLTFRFQNGDAYDIDYIDYH
jgi:proteic killer suppression protein